MDITDVRIRKFEAKGNMKAIASITLSNDIVIHDIKVFENQAGELYIAMPSRKTPDGEYKDIAHPISTVARMQLQGAIIDKYRAEVAKEILEKEAFAEAEAHKASHAAPVAEAPAVEAPAVEAPAAEESAVEEPAAEVPAVEVPAADEPKSE
jgi:stage V sporulation protein G